MGQNFLKPAYRPGFWKKCPDLLLKNWETLEPVEHAHRSALPRGAMTNTPLIIHMKTRIRARHGTRAKQPKGQLPQRNRRLLPDPTIRLRTSPSSSPAAERSSRFPRWRLKTRPGSEDFV